jgi:predicted LPLAT superfamily acyltransferase
MPSWEGKSKGTTLGYRIFVGVLKLFGVGPAYLLLRFVSLYYLLFSWKSTSVAYRFYRYHFRYSSIRSIIAVYNNYYWFGQSIIDKFVLMSGIPNRFTFDFDGEEHLRKMVQSGKGGLLLSAHIGNWEIAGHLLKRLNTSINIVLFDGEHEQIKKYTDSVTGKRQVNVIVIKNDLSHIYAINDALQNNELVCMHADRYLEGNKTMPVSFLGEQARFPLGPFIIATRFKVPVSYVFAMKENNLHYHFFASEIQDNFGGDKNELMMKMLNDFAGEMEKKVRTYPLQWYNFYNFWQQ